jgi:ABC-2 type transport system ATP-binding protein
MTGASFLAYVCDTQGLLPKRVAELLDLVGLTGASRRQVKTYSLGMRQRLGIAAAFAGDPQNLILDEPINGLDPDAIQWIRNFLRRAADEGKAVLLSSHHMSELSLVADDVVLLDQGVVARQGQLSSFVASTERNVYIESGTLEDVIRVLGDAGYHAAPYRSGALVREVEPDEVGRVVFGADRGLTHLSLLTRSLEETYFDTISIKEDIQGGTAR